jgi:predicted translin family RNA/ssDNA-binding protein
MHLREKTIENGRNIFHFVSVNEHEGVMTKVVELLMRTESPAKVKEMLKQKDDDGYNPLHV